MKKVHIIVQGFGEGCRQFSEDINEWVANPKNNVATCDFQFTTTPNGLQTCNIIYTETSIMQQALAPR